MVMDTEMGQEAVKACCEGQDAELKVLQTAGGLDWRRSSEGTLRMDAILQSVMPVSDDLAVGMVQKEHPQPLKDPQRVHYRQHGLRNQHLHSQGDGMRYRNEHEDEELLLQVTESDSLEEDQREEVAVLSVIVAFEHGGVGSLDRQQLRQDHPDILVFLPPRLRNRHRWRSRNQDLEVSAPMDVDDPVQDDFELVAELAVVGGVVEGVEEGIEEGIDQAADGCMKAAE